jgi:acyl-CoA synthetase (AMP-forming)/AMP-acid ligase II
VKIQGTIDIVRGETVKALVRLKPGETATEQEIRRYCQGRMADYKLPREVQFVDKMPAVITLWRRQENIDAAELILEG